MSKEGEEHLDGIELTTNLALIGFGDLYLHSIAISLKRIADALDARRFAAQASIPSDDDIPF